MRGGLRADDNSGPLLDPRISITIAPGTYFLGIGDEPLTAVDTDGSVWASTLVVDAGPPPDFGTLDRLRQVGTIVSPGDYVIRLSIPTADEPVSTVPEPEATFLLAASPLALALLGSTRMRAAEVASGRTRRR